MKRSTLTIICLALTAVLLASVVAYAANEDSRTISEAEIDSIINTTTDTSLVESPFLSVTEKVRDSVVGINNYQVSSGYYGYGFGYGYGRDQGRESLYATGSGVVITSYGHVLTNYHVIENASRITVTIANDENEYPAELAGYDADKDIAILVVKGLNVAPVTLGDSDSLQVGEWAIVIGNPLSENFARTVTVGVVSALDRQVTDTNYDSYGRRYRNTNTMIQVDAAINSGNSGGGMFNTLGQLQGIPARKYSSNSFFSGTSVENIAMCIPINTAKPLIEEVLRDYSGTALSASGTNSGDDSMLSKPRLGVTVTTLSSSTTDKLPLGALVLKVEEGSPAAEAGMMVGDVIVAVDGSVTSSSSALIEKVKEYKEGDTINVKVYRAAGMEEALGDGTSLDLEKIGDGDYIDVSVTLRIIGNQASKLTVK
ncbi:MAG: trypsin-like peptidase domain-containing protein [Clostridia bacterium]|nr:trypsin-like peptidase domain-containing protein [Clostridia bacterium]